MKVIVTTPILFMEVITAVTAVGLEVEAVEEDTEVFAILTTIPVLVSTF